MLKIVIAVILGCVATTCATDARGPNYRGTTRSQNGLTYGSYQPQAGYNGEMSGNLKSASNYPNYPQQMNGEMTQGSNRGGNFYPGQQQPIAPNQMQPNRMQGGDQVMGGQPMENYQAGMNEQMMGNQQPGYQGNQGMLNEQMMGNPQMGYQPGNEQMNPMGGMNPNNYGGQGMIQPGMNQGGMGMNPGMGMNQGGFQPQPNNYGNNQQQQPNPQMFNEEMGVPEERMGATPIGMGAERGMEPATFGANAAF